MNRFSQTLYRSIQLGKQKHKKLEKFVLGEQSGNFREKDPLE
jgi:hypothetical protein